MTDYTSISNSYRYARINEEHIEKYMPEDLAPLVNFLVEQCGMQLEGVYLENYKAPDTVVVMNGALPLELLEGEFVGVEGLRFEGNKVVSDKTFSTLEGSSILPSKLVRWY